MYKTIIQDLGIYQGNHLYLKREDLLPFSFGGNKARKAFLFFEDFDKGDYDCIVTYGSSSSNHCRIVANICAQRNIECYIIGPEEASEETANSKMMNLFGAEIIIVPVTEVSTTIENKINKLRREGKKPYFIPGGGHGNIGTQAYVDCYNEIQNYGVKFDYIFFASGTGTTHAGLIVGKLLCGGDENIIGISIARRNPRGRQVVIDSIKEYLNNNVISDDIINANTIFVDEYIGDGYAQYVTSVEKSINDVLIKFGIPLDPTYTGKAFDGMVNFIKANNIKNKNILFIHTGGIPLFFDFLNK